MRTRTIFALIALLTVMALPALAGNLVKNGDFSQPPPGSGAKVPEGWEIRAASPLRLVDDEGHGGSGCLRFHPEAGLDSRGFARATVTCEPNTEYVLCAWFKVEGAQVGVGFGNNNVSSAAVPYALSEQKPGWQRSWAGFTTGAGRELVIDVMCKALAGAASLAWVDDISILPAAEFDAQEAAVPAAFTPPGNNIALGCPYTIDPNPSYALCSGPGDLTQLTDGLYVEGYFWAQQGTVGWTGALPANIRVDLGSVRPIAGCSYSTAAGVAGVGWPVSILVMVSDDGRDWHLAGDLVTLSAAKVGQPPVGAYQTWRYVTDALQAHGRYVEFMVSSSGAYTFCDEVEVYRGPDSLLSVDLPPGMDNPKEWFVQQRMIAAVRTRLDRDLADVRDALARANVSEAARGALSAELAGLQKAVQEPLPPFPPAIEYRATHPLVPVQRQVFAAMASIRRAEGWPELFAWHKDRYAPLTPMELPETPPAAPTLDVAMMAGEYRADVLNLTNLSDREMTARIRIEGLPGGASPDWVTLHQVEFIETQLDMVIADALPVARKTSGSWRVTIPSGMTRQVWLNLHTEAVAPGTYRGQVVVSATGGRRLQVPLNLRVSSISFPQQPTCSLGLWDYTGDPPNYDVTRETVDEAVADMRAHFVDTPWGNPGYVPWPQDGDFDAEGNLTGTLNFATFDAWIARWPNARNYAIFLAVEESLGNFSMTDPRFGAAVESWLASWTEHMRQKGIQPSQVLLLTVDEPSTTEQDQRILTWARAIKAAQPEMVIWEDPCHEQPEKSEVPEMFDACDVLCPNLSMFPTLSEASRQFYQDLRARGKKLWFYQCSGPAPTFDPYYYDRLQHWYCWLYGAVGSGFWAYGDAALCGTSWNPLIAPRSIFTPVYLDPTSITASKHFEAIREGIEDYEYLRMLRDRIAELEAKGVPAGDLVAARQLLESAPAEVCGTYDSAQIAWTAPRDRTKADTARVRILDMLESLSQK